MTGVYETISALTADADAVLADAQSTGAITAARIRQLVENIIASVSPPETTLTWASSLAWNVDNNPVATVTLAGTTTITISGGVNGQSYRLSAKQDSTGGRTVTLSGSTTLGTPTWATAANGINFITVEMSGGTRYVAVA